MLSTKKQAYLNLARATHCSVGFFIISISINSVQNVQSEAMDETGFDKLGFFQLAIVYLCLGTGSLIAKPIMTLVGGPQRCMMIGSFFDALWILASLSAATVDKDATDVPFYNSEFFIFLVTSVTSILAGFGEAL